MRSAFTPVALLGLASSISALHIPRQYANTTTTQAATSTFPEAAGYSELSEPMSVTGTFDGEMFRFDRGGKHEHKHSIKATLTILSFMLWPKRRRRLRCGLHG